MTSLLNVMIAQDVAKLFEHAAIDDALPDDQRMMSRAEAEAVIHAVFWAYSCRNSSTSGAYAKLALFDALGLETWKFKKRPTEGKTGAPKEAS